MEEDKINNQIKNIVCPFCGSNLTSNACPECNIFIEEMDIQNMELKKENKKEEEEEEYDWREHKR